MEWGEPPNKKPPTGETPNRRRVDGVVLSLWLTHTYGGQS